jgi:hypothetical protein
VTGISPHDGTQGRTAVEQNEFLKALEEAYRFRVTFTNEVGVKVINRFLSREGAIRFLNSVILDYGYANAKLTRIARKKVS